MKWSKAKIFWNIIMLLAGICVIIAYACFAINYNDYSEKVGNSDFDESVDAAAIGVGVMVGGLLIFFPVYNFTEYRRLRRTPHHDDPKRKTNIKIITIKPT